MLIALLGASLNVIKFCLMYIPNVEGVTLLIVVYTYCFGLNIGLPATVEFCTLEGLLFGFNPTWIVSYYIHWGCVAILTHIIKLLKIKKAVSIALIIGTLTATFGLQSTFIYYLLGGAVGKANWVDRFWITYISGWAFYLTQTVCVVVMISVGFKPLSKVLDKLKNRYFLSV